MVLRHHNEAESLNAVQKMDWEWKMAEAGRRRRKAGGPPVSEPAVPSNRTRPATDDLHVPMVQVNEDFDQLLS